MHQLLRSVLEDDVVVGQHVDETRAPRREEPPAPVSILYIRLDLLLGNSSGTLSFGEESCLERGRETLRVHAFRFQGVEAGAVDEAGKGIRALPRQLVSMC